SRYRSPKCTCGEVGSLDAVSLLGYSLRLQRLLGRNEMSKLIACLVSFAFLACLAPAAIAADNGTGGGVGAEAPDLAPLPPHQSEQAAPAPKSDDTGATTDKNT